MPNALREPYEDEPSNTRRTGVIRAVDAEGFTSDLWDKDYCDPRTLVTPLNRIVETELPKVVEGRHFFLETFEEGDRIEGIASLIFRDFEFVEGRGFIEITQE